MSSWGMEAGNHEITVALAGKTCQSTVHVVAIPDIKKIEINTVYRDYEDDLIDDMGYEDPETHDWIDGDTNFIF